MRRFAWLLCSLFEEWAVCGCLLQMASQERFSVIVTNVRWNLSRLQTIRAAVTQLIQCMERILGDVISYMLYRQWPVSRNFFLCCLFNQPTVMMPSVLVWLFLQIPPEADTVAERGIVAGACSCLCPACAGCRATQNVWSFVRLQSVQTSRFNSLICTTNLSPLFLVVSEIKDLAICLCFSTRSSSILQTQKCNNKVVM